MFHEYSDDDVDQHELCHQHKDDEKDGCDNAGYTTIPDAIGRWVAIFTQCVLHDAVPVVTRRYAEQRQESDAEMCKVSVFAETLARMIVIAFYKLQRIRSNYFGPLLY